MATHSASGNPTWKSYPDQSTLVTAGALEAVENALDLSAAPAFARYHTSAATAFTFSGGTRQRVPFAAAVETSPDVVVGGGGTTFTLNRGGVWHLQAGIRLSAATASQTKYFNISDSADLQFGGIVEAQDLRAGSGGAMNVSTSYRFPSGAVVCATLLVLGNGSATVANDIPAVTFFALTWRRP